ncbi:zinc finger BED domain-containing protein RICESLEEPER 1-like [Carya illinoinensis]|uniref:zinc finger BED domain-containing protein RICESLEEPER 1-like n=1 Tax=Carya illinoinensis TaxID=32201 RepID=UPI001C71A71A|nr:zinc finger BED domain-containing protein RICESLEEPER 1-like [Carya illinoinensis]
MDSRRASQKSDCKARKRAKCSKLARFQTPVPQLIKQARFQFQFQFLCFFGSFWIDMSEQVPTVECSSASPLVEIEVDGITGREEFNAIECDSNDGNNEVDGIIGGEENPSAPIDPQKYAYQRKPRKKTSAVWKDFKIVEKNGVKKAECNFCKDLLSISSSGSTTHFHRHLTSCLPHIAASKRQKVLTIDMKGSECVNLVKNFSYDMKKVRELASNMILYHEYPFSMMEHVVFNKFMRANTPYWQKISRTTARNDCQSTYEIEKKKLKTILRGVNKVSITTDMWTSGQKISYMVITCHFVDPDWHLQKRVLNFCNVPPPHNGVIIADALQKCFIDWGIENKVSTITVDNARYNDVALRVLKDVFSLKKKLSIGGQLFHVRCCAHITNLLVKDGLSEIGEIVDCVREGVKYLVASEARIKQFSDIAKQLQLPSKKLFLDVPTRWNSTYLMLAAALEFREVFPRYGDRDQGFNYVPSVEDWTKVENVCQILAVFNEVTNIISGTEYPTANLFLPEVWRIKEVLNKKSLDLNDYIRAMVVKMNTKFDKYWGECNLLMAVAAVLDPRFKMMLVQFCFPVIYSEPEATKNIDTILRILYELYDEYAEDYNLANVESSGHENARDIGSSCSGSINVVGKNVMSGKSIFESFVRRNDTIRPVKSDLDVYLEEGVYICSEDSDLHFDALEWWKVNDLKYRILSKMARDILSISITTVASESIFSTGGRVIDPYRASMSVETVEMLLCGADWVRVDGDWHLASF